ncbi:MAG: hypothetical protein LBC20_17560 [Planctomycetaceae bacterium]|jgi:hypothetical protein|nr:hypothetical protein [Planctomycetaceae bacterium]
MITFDCPVCGKHYTFSDRFGGHSMMCTGCKTSIVVPKIEEHVPPVKPPPLPVQLQTPPLPTPPLPTPPLPTPPLPTPPLPTPISVTSSPFELPVLPMDTPDDLAILAYVFEEKQQQKQQEKENPPTQPPPVTSTANKKNEPETKKKFSFLYWGNFILIFLSFVGIGYFLIFYIDWRSPDSRPAMLETIAQHKFQMLIDAKNKEIESETLRLRSFELWNQAGESVDALIVTLGKNGIKLEDQERATKQRLNDLDNMIQTAVRQAVETENRRKNSIHDAKIYRAESQFFQECETELQEQIRQFPNDRPHLVMPVFDMENQIVPVKESVMLGSDWTENPFDCLNFSETLVDRFYAVFDTVQHLFGDKSLRITLLEQSPITVSFFENVVNDTLMMPEHSGCFTFLIRFPEITDLLRIGNDIDIGKIGSFRIRFVYSSGHIDFETVSPRYCNALFYDACGTFVPVEFPLTGDLFWKRTDQFEGSKTELDKKIIDHIELRFTPLSNRTTFWLDGIAFTEKSSREPYDLLRAEIQQTEIRNRVKEFFKHDHSTNNNSNSPSTNTNNIDSSTSTESKSIETNSMNRLFQWVLQNAHGKILIRYGDAVLSLDSQKPIPDVDETIIIEEIDLTGFRNLTEEHLNQLGNLKTIKRLNLSRTGLKNENLIKLATLISLESLNLAENELTFEGLPAIRTLKSLKELNLDGIKQSVDGIDAIGSLISLRYLSLSRSGMDNSDLMYLLPLAELEKLNLSSTKIGDRGLPIFRVFTELWSLDLSRTRITDNGLVSLIPLRNLRELKLNDTILSNACLNSLSKIQGLETISVSNTAITKDGVRSELNPEKFKCFRFTE